MRSASTSRRCRPTARFLWEKRNVVPILKVDKGLADESQGVQLMKPIPGLDEVLARAVDHGIFGTKMRSVVKADDAGGIAAVVEQQFALAEQIAATGLVPILEPEVSVDSPTKAEAEDRLATLLETHVAGLPPDATVMLKLTIPTTPGRYAALAADPRVLRVLALSGGYRRDKACALLARDPTMIASFSRALLEGLTDEQTDAEFDATLDASVEQIYRASVDKVG